MSTPARSYLRRCVACNVDTCHATHRVTAAVKLDPVPHPMQEDTFARALVAPRCAAENYGETIGQGDHSASPSSIIRAASSRSPTYLRWCTRAINQPSREWHIARPCAKGRAAGRAQRSARARESLLQVLAKHHELARKDHAFFLRLQQRRAAGVASCRLALLHRVVWRCCKVHCGALRVRLRCCP